MNARYYDPVVGRFMAIDPVGPLSGGVQHLNRYSYGYNNPFKYTDPTGLMPEESDSEDDEKGDPTVDEVVAEQQARAEQVAIIADNVTNYGSAAVELAATGIFGAVRGSVVNGYSRVKGFLGIGKATSVPKPEVTDPKLQNIVEDLYKGANTDNPIGTGSTADAVREESKTGKPVGGKFHTTKATQYRRALEKWSKKNPNASASDRAAAESMMKDLDDALGGGS